MKTKSFFLLFAAVIIMSSFGSRNTTDKTLVAGSLIQTPVVANEMMITAKLNIKPDKIKDFLIVAKEMVEKSSKESGCKSYQLYQDPYNNNSLFLLKNIRISQLLMLILPLIILRHSVQKSLILFRNRPR